MKSNYIQIKHFVIRYLSNLKLYFIIIFFLPIFSFSQSDIQNILKGGEILVNGLTILKNNKTSTINNGTVESFCVNNKLQDKIKFVLVGKDEKNNQIIKELIITQGSKECAYNLTKGIWSYEIILNNKEVYKKGEYKLESEIVVTVE